MSDKKFDTDTMTPDEWQAALDQPWTQAQLAYAKTVMGDDIVRERDGLLYSTLDKREAWALFVNYPSHFPGPPEPKTGDAERDELLARFPSMRDSILGRKP